MSARLAAMSAALLAAAACGSPTSPDDGLGTPEVVVTCIGDGSTELTCRAGTTCEALTCSGPGRDVTAEATWAVTGMSVRHVGGGRFAAAGTGAAALSARAPREGVDSRPVAVEVFPGRQPQLVFRLSGRVGHGQTSTGPFGMPVATIEQPLDGVAIEIVAGPAAGRVGVSGRPGEPRPGLSASFTGPGEFEILGVPTEPLTLEVRPPGRPSFRLDLDSPHFVLPILIPR